jgi:hypothetical protein
MIVLKEVGNIHVYGHQAERWAVDTGRWVQGYMVEFDRHEREPTICDKIFLLPIHKGSGKYHIHVLETGELLVMIGLRFFLCARGEDGPQVRWL